MCRYGRSMYKDAYACFTCRKGFKRRLDKDLLSAKESRMLKEARSKALIWKKEVTSEETEAYPTVKCPECGKDMVNLGKDLRFPKKERIEQWEAIEYLANQHFSFFTCGCSGIGIIPQNLAQAQQLIKQRSQPTEAGKILEKKRK